MPKIFGIYHPASISAHLPPTHCVYFSVVWLLRKAENVCERSQELFWWERENTEVPFLPWHVHSISETDEKYLNDFSILSPITDRCQQFIFSQPCPWALYNALKTALFLYNISLIAFPLR